MDSLVEKLTTFRRDLHQHPELGLQEHRTQLKIKEFLVSNSINNISITEAGTGLWIDIQGLGEKSISKCIAFRTEMDALCSTENTNVEWRSQNNGIHHGCGHDGHIACLLGALYIIYLNRDSIPKNCRARFIFQPGEEYHAGAKQMIKAGCLEGVDEIYAMHNWQGSLGKVYIKPGSVMAHETSFYIKITGKGGHASAPQTTNDPIVTAAQIILNLQTVVSRNISGTDTGILSVTIMNAGESYNVIPSHAELRGTVRDLSFMVGSKIKERIVSVVKHTSEMNGCNGEVWFNLDQPEYPVLINTALQTDKVIKMVHECGETTSSEGLPILGSEDFAFYLEKVPGCMFFLGNGMDISCHNDTFDFNDQLLNLGIGWWVNLAQYLLFREPKRKD